MALNLEILILQHSLQGLRARSVGILEMEDNPYHALSSDKPALGRMGAIAHRLKYAILLRHIDMNVPSSV